MKRLFTIVLAAAVITAGVYFFLRRKAPAPAVALPELLALVPRDVVALGYFDFAAMRSSAFWQKTTALFPPGEQDPEYLQFVEQTGFDYSRDLDRAVIAWHVANALHIVELAIVEGRFDRLKIRAYATKHGERQEAGGVETFRFRRKGSADLILAFLSDARVILAKSDGAGETYVRSFFQSPRTHQPFEANLQRRLSDVSGAAAFVVGRVEKGKQKPSNAHHGLVDKLQELQGSVAWVTLAARPENDRLQVLLQAECDGTWKAMQLGLLLDGFKLLAKSALQDPQNVKDLTPEEAQELRKLLDNAVTSRDGNRVRARIHVSHTLIRLLVEKGKKEQGKSVGR